MSLVHNTLTPDIETASEDYARRFSGPVGAFFLSVQERAVLELVGAVGPAPLSILEVGGGHAQLTEALLRKGHTVAVQGSSQEGLRRIDALQPHYQGRVEAIVSPLWEIPREDQSFDLVIAVRLLAHVEKWQELLAQMSRLASKAVIFDYASLGALNALTPLLFRFKRQIERNTRPYFSYRSQQLHSAMQPLGFSHVQDRRQFFFPMGLHRALGSAPLSSMAEAAASAISLTRFFGSPAISLYMRFPKSLRLGKGKI